MILLNNFFGVPLDLCLQIPHIRLEPSLLDTMLLLYGCVGDGHVFVDVTLEPLLLL